MALEISDAKRLTREDANPRQRNIFNRETNEIRERQNTFPCFVYFAAYSVFNHPRLLPHIAG
jgi:hypothetical protein